MSVIVACLFAITCSCLMLHVTGSEAEPSPNEYSPDKASSLITLRAPSFTHGRRRGGTNLWQSARKYIRRSGTKGPTINDQGAKEKSIMIFFLAKAFLNFFPRKGLSYSFFLEVGLQNVFFSIFSAPFPRSLMVVP